jgi:hypothetical protein
MILKRARLYARALWPIRRRQIEVAALLSSLHLVNQESGRLSRNNVKYCFPLTRSTSWCHSWYSSLDFFLHRLSMSSGGIGIWLPPPCLMYSYAFEELVGFLFPGNPCMGWDPMYLNVFPVCLWLLSCSLIKRRNNERINKKPVWRRGRIPPPWPCES